MPDNSNPAIIFRNEQLSFKELENQSNQLAHYLSSLGVKPRTMVPIMITRGIDMMIGMIGIMKAGCAYVPIDANFPAERVNFMLKDVGSSTIVMDKATVNQFQPGEHMQIINMDDDREKIKKQPKRRLPVKLKPKDLAYMIYTSGSTGNPKGVMIEHRNLASMTVNLMNVWGMRKGMRVGAMGVFTFDLSIVELLSVLTIGITIVLIDEKDPAIVLKQLEEHKVNVVQLTPSRLNLLTYGETDLTPLRRMEVIMIGGEQLQERTFRKLKEELREVRIYNVYGPTETTVWSSSQLIHETDVISIGKPLIHEQLYILDNQGKLLPPGIAGEICIGGSGVARGYLNREELTAEKFVPDVFSKKKGARLYKTGDIGKQLDDGRFVFLGRKDDQVKIRGYRVEIGDVENALLRVKGVEHSAVKCLLDKKGRNYLVGYYVSQIELGYQEVTEQLTTIIPSYMVPSVLMKLSVMPLNNNGKIDRRSLPDPGDNLVSQSKYVPPSTELEEGLLMIWRDLLGVKKIGVEDNFFEIGGHSLLVVDLIARIKKQYKLEISLPMIFQLKTVAAIAAYIEVYAIADNVPVEEDAYDVYDL